jgi:hypothetical protein
MLDVTPASLFTNLILSAIGFGLFTYGKKSERWPQMVGGLLLMVYPYFVSSTTQLITGGVIIGGGLVAAVALGY